MQVMAALLLALCLTIPAHYPAQALPEDSSAMDPDRRIKRRIRWGDRTPSEDPPEETRVPTPRRPAPCASDPEGTWCGGPLPERVRPDEPSIDPEALARELVARVTIPDPKPIIGPDPQDNEWKMAAVGYPLWLWTKGPTHVRDTVTAYGVRFRLTATWRSTTFDMDDGNRFSCTRTEAYSSKTKPGKPSPVCGHTYLQPSKYSVRATTYWRVRWRATGGVDYSGSTVARFSGTRTIRVGELNSLVKG